MLVVDFLQADDVDAECRQFPLDSFPPEIPLELLVGNGPVQIPVIIERRLRKTVVAHHAEGQNAVKRGGG